jgi:hypothetical protein
LCSYCLSSRLAEKAGEYLRAYARLCGIIVNQNEFWVTATPWFPLECGIKEFVPVLFNNFFGYVSKMFNSYYYNGSLVVTIQSIFLAEEGINIILRINSEFQQKLWGVCMFETDNITVNLLFF